MSDGPHRSLKMTPAWKRVAERAELAAFSAEEVAAAAEAALEQDCGHEIGHEFLQTLKRLMGANEPSLFPDQQKADLAALQRASAGHPMAANLVDWIAYAYRRGLTGMHALFDAMTNTLRDRSQRAALQMEEHYKRRAPARQAIDVRDRVVDAMRACSPEALARRLLGLDEGSNRNRSPKHDGLDDGVQL